MPLYLGTATMQMPRCLADDSGRGKYSRKAVAALVQGSGMVDSPPRTTVELGAGHGRFTRLLADAMSHLPGDKTTRQLFAVEPAGVVARLEEEAAAAVALERAAGLVVAAVRRSLHRLPPVHPA